MGSATFGTGFAALMGVWFCLQRKMGGGTGSRRWDRETRVRAGMPRKEPTASDMSVTAVLMKGP